MISNRDIRRFVSFFPAVKIATTTIPLTFFDFFTDVYSITIYAASPAAVVRAAAALLGKYGNPFKLFFLFEVEPSGKHIR